MQHIIDMLYQSREFARTVPNAELFMKCDTRIRILETAQMHNELHDIRYDDETNIFLDEKENGGTNYDL